MLSGPGGEGGGEGLAREGHDATGLPSGACLLNQGTHGACLRETLKREPSPVLRPLQHPHAGRHGPWRRSGRSRPGRRQRCTKGEAVAAYHPTRQGRQEGKRSCGRAVGGREQPTRPLTAARTPRSSLRVAGRWTQDAVALAVMLPLMMTMRQRGTPLTRRSDRLSPAIAPPSADGNACCVQRPAPDRSTPRRLSDWP